MHRTTATIQERPWNRIDLGAAEVQVRGRWRLWNGVGVFSWVGRRRACPSKGRQPAGEGNGTNNGHASAKPKRVPDGHDERRAKSFIWLIADSRITNVLRLSMSFAFPPAREFCARDNREAVFLPDSNIRRNQRGKAIQTSPAGQSHSWANGDDQVLSHVGP